MSMYEFTTSHGVGSFCSLESEASYGHRQVFELATFKLDDQRLVLFRENISFLQLVPHRYPPRFITC